MGDRDMAERIWDRFLTDKDRQVFAAAGLGALAGLGKRPALIVIDVNYAFCGEEPLPILEAIQRWSTSCGEAAWQAIPYIRRLIDACHGKGLPVIYTTGIRRADRWDTGSWGWKHPASAKDGTPATRPNAPAVDGDAIVAEIAPAPQDIVVTKRKPSGFFGTDLASFLTLLGCDSLIVTGTTTSGCVRATVIDAFSLNYRVTIAEEACFDRVEASHALNLCDMHAKYADVVPTADVLTQIAALPDGLFVLPRGA